LSYPFTRFSVTVKKGHYFVNIAPQIKCKQTAGGREGEKKEGNFLINVTSSLYPDLTSTQPMKTLGL